MSITVRLASSLCFAVAVALLTFPLTSVRATAAPDTAPRDGKVRGYEYEGPFAQFGVAVGQIDFDGNNIDNNASGGFTMTGGYRFLPWLAGEANFTYLGGGAVERGSRDIGNGSFFAFTFGPKVYPLGAFKVKQVPEFFQPYATIGIGGGEFHIEHSSFDRSGFIARFILGADFWATDHIGFFVEGGGHVTDQDHVDGVGIFTVGGQYRF
jgi:hypothetical protein